MSYFVPDGVSVRLNALPIALWSSDYTQGTFCKRREEQQRFKVGFSPVQGAFVACIRTSTGTTSLKPAAWVLRCGRTNDFGWVLKRERDDLGREDETPRSGWKKKGLPPGGVKDPDAVPSDAGTRALADGLTDAMDAGVAMPHELATFGPDDAAMLELDSSDANAEALWVLPNEQYSVFWCYDAQLFAKFLAAYDADPAETLQRFAVPRYVVAPFRAAVPVEQLRELSPREQAFVARLLAPDPEGYHGGWPSLDGMAAAIFDGTPRRLRTLFLCEWLDWCCRHFVHDDPDWSYLLALRATIRAAEAGEPIPDLAQRLPDVELEVTAPVEAQVRAAPSARADPDDLSAAKGKRAGQMRLYLHQLAKEGMDQRGFATALVDVWGESKFHGHWAEVAEAMQKRYGVQHPAMGAYKPEFRFSSDERAALVAYFDVYRLGFERADDAEALDAHWRDVQQVLEGLRARQKALLSAVGDEQLKATLGLCVPRNDSKRRVALAARYHALSSELGIKFWERAEVALSTPSAWDELKPFVTWMAETDGLLGEVFQEFLERYAKQYRDLTSESVERLLNYLYGYQANLCAGTTLPLPTTNVIVQVAPDPSTGRVVATLFRRSKETKLLELDLLTSVTTAPGLEAHAPVGTPSSDTTFKRLQRAPAVQTRTFAAQKQTLRVPDDTALTGFPKALAAAAAGLKTGMAAAALIDELAKNAPGQVEVDLYLDLAQESLQAVGPGVDLLAPLLERIGGKGSRAGRLILGGSELVGRALGAAGLLLESGRNVFAGGATLATFFTPKSANTDLARYLDRRQTVPALLETTKGLMQVGTGLSGLGAVMLGTGTVMAAVPLGTWVAMGLVSVAMLDVVIYVDTGGGSPVDGFLDSVRQARRAQFELVATQNSRQADRILLPHEEIVEAGHKEKHRRPATCLLARRARSLQGVLDVHDPTNA